jgi:uncharacterized membrane protein YozB (DUF420 family)
VSPPRRFSVLGLTYIALAVAFVLLAIPTGLVALGEGAGSLALPFNLHLTDQRLPGVFKLHMLASGAALVLIPLVIALRRHRRWHRPLGRITAVFVVLGALSAFPVAWESSSVAMARFGFAAQGAAWLSLVVAGVIAIRRKNMQRHAELMLAVAAVASGAIWVRLTTAVATSYDLPFDPIYGCAAWAGWIVPWALVTLAGTRILSSASIRGTHRPLASGSRLA